MASCDVLIPFIRSWEGGWSDDPKDSGGATMCGITMATFTAWRTGIGLPRPTKDDLRHISDAEWRDIFLYRYWRPLRADEFWSQAVANMLVDWYWHSGIVAVRTLQRLVRTEEDGIIGIRTLAKLNARDPRELFTELRNARIKFLTDLAVRKPSQNRFLAGWLRRVNSIEYDTLRPNK